MSPVQSFQSRYEKIVSETLDKIAAPSQMVSYGVSVALEEIQCGHDEDHYLEVPAVSVFWTVQDGLLYDVAYFSVVLLPKPIEEDEMAMRIAEAWAEMVFYRQANAMADLDQEMDALADGDGSA